MSAMIVFVIFLGIIPGVQLFRSLRIVIIQRVPRFQSYDDVTKPFSQRYREGAERLTSGRQVGRYEGATRGKRANIWPAQVCHWVILEAGATMHLCFYQMFQCLPN